MKLSFIHFLPYILLNLMMVSCWFIRREKILIIASALIIFFGYAIGSWGALGLGILLLYGVMAFVITDKQYLRQLQIILLIIFVALSTGLLLHALPGFYNIKFFDKVQFAGQSLPFTMYLNFDKPFIGLALLVFFKIERVKSLVELREVFKKSLPVYLILIITVIPVAMSTNYIALNPKYPPWGWVWMINNLVIVCVTEEAFFRGFIQSQLRNRWGSLVAVLGASFLFGLLHYRGGLHYIVLSILAGLFYGIAFERVKKIEAAIIVHFLLNLTHFLFFSYPALKI